MIHDLLNNYINNNKYLYRENFNNQVGIYLKQQSVKGMINNKNTIENINNKNNNKVLHKKFKTLFEKNFNKRIKSARFKTLDKILLYKPVRYLIKKKFGIKPDCLFNRIYTIYINIIILYSISVSPYISVFYNIDSNSKNAYYLLEIIMEISFLFDLIYNFFLGYIDNGKLILSLKLIAMHYLFGYFIFDLVSSIPLTLLDINKKYTIARISKFPRYMKFLKITKFFRFIKLLKNKQKLTNIIGNVYSNKPGIDRLIISVMILIIIIHIFSCIWYSIGNDLSDNLGWVFIYDINMSSPSTRYLVSLYWSIQTIFTVGYGDYGATNSTEYLFAILLFLIGIIIYSFIIGSITDLIFNFNKIEIEKNKLKETNSEFVKK